MVIFLIIFYLIEGKEFYLQDEEKIARNGKDKFPIVYFYPKTVNISKMDKHMSKLISMVNVCVDLKAKTSYNEVS